MEWKCQNCELRQLARTREFEGDELEAVEWFRGGDVEIEKGTQILRLEASSHLYTLYDGFAFRHIALPDGRRQILNMLFPGDLIGLQASLFDRSDHAVEALTDVRLCLFDKDKMTELFQRTPELGYDVTWISAMEQRFLDLNLVAVGRYRGDQRIAYFLLYFLERMRAISRLDGDTVAFPLRQQHIADSLGLSVPYTSKALKKLASQGICRVKKRELRVLDWNLLRERAVTEVRLPERIPFI